MNVEALSLLEVLQGLFLLSLGVLWGMLREEVKSMKRAHDELEKKVDRQEAAMKDRVSAVKVELARDYMPRTELSATFDSIASALQRIETKLDKKADK